MDGEKKLSRLGNVMSVLGVSAKRLSGLCGISNSLISRWQNGSRPLTPRSRALEPLGEALLSLDDEGRLQELLAPWRSGGESTAEALRLYLTGEALPALPPRAQPPAVQRSGSYIAQQQVLLGAQGFRKAALLMLDYVMQLPPGQQVVVCAHSAFEFWHKDLPFALQFLQKLNKAIKRGARFLLVNRRAPGLDGSPFFSVFWLTVHLKGTLRSRYYEGEGPEEYFVASIPGYWSARVEGDETAEDGVITTLYTDPRNTRRDEAHCNAHIAKSAPASQYGFLRRPGGDENNGQGWRPGSLPLWEERGAPAPDGSFSAICRTPSFGVMTREEFASVSGKTALCIPEYLFNSDGLFAPGPHRIILCREDVQEGLTKTRRRNEALSELLGRNAFVPRAALAAQLKRLLDAMAENEAFEVALMPRSAFDKLELELIHWRNSVSLAWLQNGEESMFDNDPIIARSFSSALDYTWSRLHKGWKRKASVMRTLRKWLAGRELDVQEEDSAFVQHWELLPRE